MLVFLVGGCFVFVLRVGSFVFILYVLVLVGLSIIPLQSLWLVSLWITFFYLYHMTSSHGFELESPTQLC